MTVLSRDRRQSQSRDAVTIADVSDQQLQGIVDAEIDAQVLMRARKGQFIATHANRAAREVLGESLNLPAVGALKWACEEVWTTARGINLSDVLLPGERRWVDIRIRRLYGQLSVTLVDVSPRHEERVSLLESQCRYRMFAEHAGDLVFSVRGRRVEWVSASIRDLLGWEQSDVVGRRIVDLVHPGDRDRVLQACQEATEPALFEARFRRQGRDYVRLSVEMRPATDLVGGVTRVGSCRQVCD